MQMFIFLYKITYGIIFRIAQEPHYIKKHKYKLLIIKLLTHKYVINNTEYSYEKQLNLGDKTINNLKL